MAGSFYIWDADFCSTESDSRAFSDVVPVGYNRQGWRGRRRGVAATL
eukprot:gene8763-2459_t